MLSPMISHGSPAVKCGEGSRHLPASFLCDDLRSLRIMLTTSAWPKTARRASQRNGRLFKADDLVAKNLGYGDAQVAALLLQGQILPLGHQVGALYRLVQAHG